MEWKRVLHKLPWLLLIPLGLWLPRLASRYPDFIERYFSRVIYPYISDYLGYITSYLPFSLAEVLAYSIVLLTAILLVVYILRLLFRRISFPRFLSFLLTLCTLAGLLLNVFYFCWGFNYSRKPLSELLQLDVRERSVDELESLCYALADKAAGLRANLPEDEAGIFTIANNYQYFFYKIPEAYEALGEDCSLFQRTVYPVKPVIASVAMSYAGISGIFIGITGEANVNVDQPPLLLLSSAAHESAHYLGIASEDEANFVAFLACMYSDIPALQYSGCMLALIHSANRLYAADASRYQKLLEESYSDGMRRDLADHTAYWDSFEGPIEEAVDSANDSYLKFNQQEDGVKSYGMMVDLLLAYYYSFS